MIIEREPLIAQIEEFRQYGEKLYHSLTEEDKNPEVVREEICTGANIHRGFYYPSPVFEKIVGHTHRGKLLKRKSTRSNYYFKYGFNAEGKLVKVETFSNQKRSHIEILKYYPDKVVGIEFEPEDWGENVSICEENYSNDKLSSVQYLYYYTISGSPYWMNYRREEYRYHKDNLCACAYTSVGGSDVLQCEKTWWFIQKSEKGYAVDLDNWIKKADAMKLETSAIDIDDALYFDLERKYGSNVVER